MPREDLSDCVKLTDKKYKGRPSPPFHANACKNKILEGNDGKNYISRQDKNGVYKWFVMKPINQTKTPMEYYGQYPGLAEPIYNIKPLVLKLNKVKKELLKDHIFLFKTSWKSANFIDFAWSEAFELLKKNPYVKKKLGKPDDIQILDNISFLFYTENELFWASIKGLLPIQHNIHDKKTVDRVFKQVFGRDYKWDGSIKKTIVIKISDKV